MQTTYYDRARLRWPERYIKGAGQFAVIPLDTPTVTLCMTYAEAQEQILNPKRVMICDLAERPLPDFSKMKDIETKEERRERRRAVQQP